MVGKRHLAAEVWARFGDPHMYAEPFAGMLGVFLSRPLRQGEMRREIIVDADAMVSNFWRSVRYAPDVVVREARQPAIQVDLIAKKRFCYDWAQANKERLCQDPKFYDAEAAGWWAWGMNNSIGNFCIDRGADSGIGGRPQTVLVGMNAITMSDEEARQLVMSVSDRLRYVKLLAGDWTSGVTQPLLTESCRITDDSVAVFLDPPYKTDNQFNNGRGNLYSSDVAGKSDDVATESYEWAVANGEKYKVAYCCATGDFPCPAGWSEIRSRFRKEQVDGYYDVIYFSPTCIQPAQRLL